MCHGPSDHTYLMRDVAARTQGARLRGVRSVGVFGVIGAAVARLLSRRKTTVLVVE